MYCFRTLNKQIVKSTSKVLTVANVSALLCACLLLLSAGSQAKAADAWSERHVRTNVLALALNGFGSSTAVAYGFFEVDYMNANPEQPVDLVMSDFDLGARFPLFNGVHIYLNDRIESYGHIRPAWAYYDDVSVGDGSFFPAVNDNIFFLELRIEQMNQTCLSRGPVTLIADINEWPPPPGTVYDVEEKVNFKSIDKDGQYQALGLTVHLDTNLRAWFYEKGAIDVSLREVKRAGSEFRVEGTIRSNTDSVFAHGWSFYTGGKLIEMESPHADTMAAQYGDFSGHDTLWAAGEEHSKHIDLRMRRPGVERLYLMVAGREIDFVGDKRFLEIRLPDRGLEVKDIDNWRVKRGGQSEIRITGSDFREPLGLEFEGDGISVAALTLESPETLRASLNIDANAAAMDRNVTVLSADRSFTVVNGLRVKRKNHMLTGVDLDTIVSGQNFTMNIYGERFPERVYVSLGDSVVLKDMLRKSESEIVVEGLLPNYYEGVKIDVVVAGALHSAVLKNAVHVENGNPDMLAGLFPMFWYLAGGLILICGGIFVGLKVRRRQRPKVPINNNGKSATVHADQPRTQVHV